VPAGNAFDNLQRYDIEQAIQHAEATSGLLFSVHVGTADEEPRAFAERLHASLAEPARTVLVVVDPGHRWLQIVTGAEAQLELSDEDCRLASLAMTSAFAAGDLAGGLSAGVQQLGEHAHHPDVLHAEAQ
jgi:uncharacterized membrane protein YgcG